MDVYLYLLGNSLFVRGKEVQLMLVDVVNALEAETLTDRPAQRANLDFELCFQLVEHIKRVASLTVHLVDEDDYRGISHAAHLHKFAGLCLHTLGRVNHDDG